MISVVIATNNDERTLGQCLAALVSAAIDGLVREVILADAGSADHTLEIADDAGARVVQGGLDAAIAMARSDWLLIVDVGVAAPPGWDEAVAAHLNGGPAQAAWWGSAPLLGRKRVQGLLVSKRAYGEAGYLGALSKAKRLKL
jgi:glycosyltransferase involved in cell wall biosynthesis